MTAPFITVGLRAMRCRISAIMPVTVDLPLVPPIAIDRAAAIEQPREQLCAGQSLARPAARAATMSGTVVLHRRRGDHAGDGGHHAAAVLRVQCDALGCVSQSNLADRAPVVQRCDRTR